MQTLSDLVVALEKKLPNRPALKQVIVRIALQTGVDLNRIAPDQDFNPRIVEMVKTALRELGCAIP